MDGIIVGPLVDFVVVEHAVEVVAVEEGGGDALGEKLICNRGNIYIGCDVRNHLQIQSPVSAELPAPKPANKDG